MHRHDAQWFQPSPPSGRARRDSFTYPTTSAAWKTIPSWGLVTGQDKAIPPACERWMYGRANARKVVEVPHSSHVAMISHPKIVADLIRDAAEAIS